MNVILNRDVEPFPGQGKPPKKNREFARALREPVTPKSERARKTWGSLAVSVQAVGGLCAKGKCFRRAFHEGDCYPT